MPENKCSQNVLIRICVAVRDVKFDKKVQKGISDSDDVKNYLCVKCWLCKQEVASSVAARSSNLVSFFFVIIYQQ